jgi:hypothetical protein
MARGALRASQWAGLDERLSPAAATRKRRTHWASRDEAWRHFREKPAFARWDERMLSDYIDYGIPQAGADGARTLAFDRQVEYLIYRTLPHTLGPRLAHGAPVPVGFLAGTRSREVRQVGLDATHGPRTGASSGSRAAICSDGAADRDGPRIAADAEFAEGGGGRRPRDRAALVQRG